MTALTLPARPGADDASPRPVPWRRMAGVTWRQHRFALVGVATLLGALAVVLWIIGLQLHHAYAAAIACHRASSPACQDLVNTFNSMDSFLSDGVILQAVPVLIGAFLGAPVLARELETGTFRYAWTQGFGRWRWTLAKLVPLAILLVAATGAFGVLLSWYYQPYFATGNQALGLIELSPFNPGVFDLREVAFPAWALAAFAIGALAGMLIRRVVPAIATTLVVYAGLAFAAGLYLREHYLTPLLTTNLSLPGDAWIFSQWWTKGGTTVSQSTMHQVMDPLFQRLMPAVPPDQVHLHKLPTILNAEQYLTQHGYTYWTSYQPGSRYWPIQWIEGAWLLALSVLLIAATVWLVRRRAIRTALATRHRKSCHCR